MITRTNQRSPWLWSLGSWCVLVVYLAVASPAGLAFFGLVAALDRDHQACLVQDAGTTRLVLHHRSSITVHRHGPVAQTLAVLASQQYATNPDHVIQFPSAPASIESGSSELSPASLVAANPQTLAVCSLQGLPLLRTLQVNAGSSAFYQLSTQLLI